MRVNKIAFALGLTSVITIVGCDSGGSSSSSATSPSTPTTYSVKAIDGYLRNAKVWLDINRDFLHDKATEPSAVTGEGGVANLDVSDIENYQDYQIVVHAIAGQTIDEDTVNDSNPAGDVMTGSMVLSAPAGETNVTPLSSFVNVLMNKNPNALDDPEQQKVLKQQAVNEVASQLGLDPDSLLDDYLDEEDSDPQAAFAAQSIVKSQQVLPKSPEDMAGLAQDVQSAGDSASEDVPELMIAEAVNGKIKQVVQNTDEDDLADTPPPVAPPQDGIPPIDDDADGVPNDLDEFPNDENEWLDSDDDGMGNNEDAFPYDASEKLDTDSDGTGNNADLDDDNDGFNDDTDTHPLNALQAGDHDLDGIDSVDDEYPFDHDNDSYPDDEDAFDDDPTEWLDTDDDGTGNNKDDDDDGDGFDDGEDEFPLDNSKAGDPDNDGEDSVSDAYPYDHDNDGYNDDVDPFDDDPTEWADNDADGTGDNADLDDDNDGIDDVDDLHPLDETKAGDPDKDGVDTLVDAYPNDGEKSVADQVSANSALMPVLNINHRQVMTLNVDVTKTVETFNNATVKTTMETRFTSEDGVEYGYKESIDIQDGGDFTRIEDFQFDFDLDGSAGFIGRTLDIGTRTPTSEVFWRYVDESDATPEGGVNGEGRTFEGTDFSLRTHPADLDDIDTVQSFSVTFSEGGGQNTALSNMTQFDVAGFDYSDEATHVANYASINNTSRVDMFEVSVKDEQDWDADGSINTVLSLEAGADGAYTTHTMMPIWANPQDGVHEEYADFNYTAGNWDNLTSYWYQYVVEYNADGSMLERGERYVLDGSTNAQLTDVDNPDGYLFHKWQMETNFVNDSERNEHVTWTSYALDDYDFTASVDDPGQAYRINTLVEDGLWLTWSFDEWGSADVENLPEKIENARSGGTAIADINDSIVAGLSRYAAQLPNETFQYHADGTPRQWYVVTQDPRMTDGTPSVVSVTLSQDGLMPNSYVVSNGPDLILVAAIDENNIDAWFNAYYRQRIDMYSIDMTPGHFNWISNIGQFYVDQSDAEARLTDILNPTYRVCSQENTGELADNVVDYWDFVSAANNCGYIGIDASYLDGLTLYYQEDDQTYFSYQFNTDGSGAYSESNGYTHSISWFMTDTGIISIDNGGDPEHFAYIVDENGNYSMLGFFEWYDNGTPYSEIIGMDMSTSEPVPPGDYQVCTDGDTEWDDVNDRPLGAPQYADLQQAVTSCGGAMPFSADMLDGLVWHDYNADKDRLKIWSFNSDGTVTKTKNGVVSGTFTWIIDANGYLKIIYSEENPDDFTIFALIATEDDKYSLKTLDSYLEDGQLEYWSEIVAEEYVATNPLDKSGVITALTTQTNWFSPWAEWDEDLEKDYLHLDQLNLTQPELLALTQSSIVKADKSLLNIDISDDFDIILTANGWAKVTGFEFNLAGNNIVGASPSAPSLTYSIIYAGVYDKEGGNIAQEAPGDWVQFTSDNEYYPNGSQVVAITLRSEFDNYLLNDGWPVYLHRGDSGHESDSDIVNSLDELFTQSSVGSGSQADLLHAASIGEFVSVELVRPNGSDTSGGAYFYTTDWQGTYTTLQIASGAWELRLVRGEELVVFEIPQSVIDNYGNHLDSSWMIYSVYPSDIGGDDRVHVGEFFEERSEQEEVYLYNSIAKDAIITAASIQ